MKIVREVSGPFERNRLNTNRILKIKNTFDDAVLHQAHQKRGKKSFFYEGYHEFMIRREMVLQLQPPGLDWFENCQASAVLKALS